MTDWHEVLRSGDFIEITTPRGTKGMAWETHIGNKSTVQFVWNEGFSPNEADVEYISVVVTAILKSAGCIVDNPVRFASKREMEKIQMKHLGGGRG